MAKKDRNRLTPKKKNNIPRDVEIAKEIAHGEEHSAKKRKHSQGQGKHQK
jgi:hypothetical protein